MASVVGRIQAQRPVRRDPSLPPSTLLWTPTALFRWGVIVGVSAIVCVAAWGNVSGKAIYSEQVTGINIAVISVVVASAASIGLLLSGRRTVGIRRVALLGEPGNLPAQAAPAHVSTPIVDPALRGVVPLVGAPGLLHYHRADCPMALGRNWTESTELEHERAGRTPCGVCRP